MDLFDKLKQVRISKRARRGAVLGLCLCAAAGLGMHLLTGGAPVGCTQEDLADTRAVMAVQASVSGSTDAQSGAAADKVVYLTFDDGPSATTESVLDTLKAEGFHMCPRTMKSNGCAFPAAAPTPSATATAAVIS